MKLSKLSIFFLINILFLDSISAKIKKEVPRQISLEKTEEMGNVSLKIIGNIPKWLSGTLIRNGPVKVYNETVGHFFDEPGMLHAFAFDNGIVRYTNKFLRSNVYDLIFNEGAVNYGDFAKNADSSLFNKFLSYFRKKTNSDIQNANVNVAKLDNTYVALTEKPLPVKFDLKTLETLGVFDYQDQLPKKDYWESAHPHYDYVNRQTINYFIFFGWNSCYTIYSIEDNSSERKIIARIPVSNPSYMHSFSVTENYIILTEFPFRVKPLDLLFKRKSFIHNFNWQQEEGTNFIVISRFNGSVIGNYKTNSFFSFHHANAFEQDACIYVDMVVYDNADILTNKTFYQQKDKKQVSTSIHPLKRFIVDLNKKNITEEILLEKSCEFPRINELLDGKIYRYAYVAGSSSSRTSSALYKVDTDKKEFLYWKEENCIVGEPIFVAKPEMQDEDDGVILTIILNELDYGSFLLILDAKTFQEIGRAITPNMLQKGLHSQFFK